MDDLKANMEPTNIDTSEDLIEQTKGSRLDQKDQDTERTGASQSEHVQSEDGSASADGVPSSQAIPPSPPFETSRLQKQQAEKQQHPHQPAAVDLRQNIPHAPPVTRTKTYEPRPEIKAMQLSQTLSPSSKPRRSSTQGTPSDIWEKKDQEALSLQRYGPVNPPPMATSRPFVRDTERRIVVAEPSLPIPDARDHTDSDEKTEEQRDKEDKWKRIKEQSWRG